MLTSLVVAGFLSLAGGAEDATPLLTALTSTPVGAAGPQDEAPVEEKKLPHWSGFVDFTLLEKQGNTESTTGSLASKIRREAEPSLTTITTWWLYEVESGTITERKYGTLAKYDWYLTEAKKSYLYGLGQIGTDFSAGIDTRYYTGGGVGYVWRDDEKVRFSTDVGLTYLKEEFRDGTDDGRGNGSLIYDLTWKPNDKVQVDSDLIAQMALRDSEDVLLAWANVIAWDIGYDFRLGLRYLFNWNNQPAVGAKRDDHQIGVVLGWSFGG